uniref:Clathrin-coat assembly protein-like protein n=1 Tax=Annona cherimola TaxID=49314 RepID=C0L7E6_ANNCH|nr:clathrin-coat assembly protein-like protein [Annona cherimola]
MINKDSKYIVELEADQKKDDVQNHGEESNGSTRTWSSPDMGSWKIVIADEDTQRKSLETKPETQAHAFGICGLITSVESTTKSKWLRNNFRKVKGNEDLLPNKVSNYLNSGGITRVAQGIRMLTERSRNCFSSCEGDSNVSRVKQLFGRVGGFKRQAQGIQYYPQFGRSLQIIIIIMLTIFITAPFVVYSN